MEFYLVHNRALINNKVVYKKKIVKYENFIFDIVIE